MTNHDLQNTTKKTKRSSNANPTKNLRVNSCAPDVSVVPACYS